jgi:hypothetical protein
MENKVTLFITACNRPDLLLETLQSFVKYNTYPIEEAIICEDSGKDNINDFVKDLLPFPCKLIYNIPHRGQMRSIENGVQYIKTPYVFHCEEDWEFYDYGFIEKSLEILKKDTKVTSVWLLAYDYIIQTFGEHIQVEPHDDYYIINPSNDNFSLNPGLRTLEVQQACIPYPFATIPHFHEYSLQDHFRDKKMYSAITNYNPGYVRHIGWDRHVVDLEFHNG